MQLYDYQSEAVEKVISQLANGSSALLAPTGSGKTIVACTIAKRMNRRLIVVAPLGTIPNWQREINIVQAEALLVVNYELLREGNCRIDGKTTKCPYLQVQYRTDTAKGQVIRKFCGYRWTLPPNVLVVFDEAHRGKNGILTGHTMNSQLISSIRSAVNPAQNTGSLLLSATITDGVESSDVLCYVLGLYKPYEQSAFERWVKSANVTDMIKLMYLLVPKYATKMDPGAHLTSTTVKCLQIDATPEDAARIEALNREIHNIIQKVTSKGKKVTLIDIIDQWRPLELLKAGIILPRIDKWVQKNYAIAVMCNFTETRERLDELVRASKIPVSIDHIYGEMSAEAKESARARFQADQIQLLLVNIRCCSEGINLKGEKPRRVVVYVGMSGTITRQAIGRFKRLGGNMNVKVYLLFVRNSPTEARLAAIQTKKLDNLQHVGGGLLEMEKLNLEDPPITVDPNIDISDMFD